MKFSIKIPWLRIIFVLLSLLAFIFFNPSLFDSPTKIASFLILSVFGLMFIYLSFWLFKSFLKGFGYNQFWDAGFPFFTESILRSKKETNMFSRINTFLISILLLIIGLGLVVATFLKY